MIGVLVDLYRRISPRHRAYLPVVPMCVLGGAAWAFYDGSQEPAQFTSTGRIVAGGRMNLPAAETFSEELSNFLGTQLEIIRSEDLTLRARQQLAVSRPDLTGHAWLNATLIRGTSIILVESTGTNSEFTRHFLDAVLDQFIESRRDRRLETTGLAMQRIREELPNVERQLARQEEELFRFKENHNMGFWGRQAEESGLLLSQLTMRAAQLRMQMNLSAIGDPHDPSDASPPTGPPPSNALPSASEETHALQRKIFSLEIERDQELAVFRERHPRVARITQELERHRKLFDQITIQNRLSEAAARNAFVRELSAVTVAIGEAERKALESARTGAAFEKLNTSVERTRELYNRLLASLDNIDLGQGTNLDIVQILQRASQPRELARSPVRDARGGALFGLFAGLGLMLALAKADTRAYSTSELIAASRAINVVEVPRLPELARARILDDNITFPAQLQEAMRRVLAQIHRKPAPGIPQTPSIVVCLSHQPGEGKSTMALGLAVQAAQSGISTLLIDADLRRGHLAETLGLESMEPGFAELIDGTASEAPALFRSLIGGRLAFLPRGQARQTTVDRFAQWLSKDQLPRLAEGRELVVIDAAPLGPVADSDPLINLTDHVLLVSRIRKTRLAALRESAASIRRKKDRNFILVINEAPPPPTSSDYYAYYSS